MLPMVWPHASQRKLRLFVCECCRRCERWIDPRVRAFIDVAETYADGRADAAGLRAARREARSIRVKVEARIDPGIDQYVRMVQVAVSERGLVEDRIGLVVHDAANSIEVERWIDLDHNHHREVLVPAGRRKMCELIRDLFGNPFYRADFDQNWQTSTVTALAECIYAQRSFEAMPILSDALEDAGCNDREILRHCRAGDLHARGCWVLDQILEKG